MHRKLIVFDWNGTLLSDTAASWRAANICLEFYGAPAISLKRYRETFHFPVIHFYKLNGCSVDQVLARKDEANHLFQSTYEEMAKSSRTRSGARTILDQITENGISCIILSNYLTDRIENHLKRLKMEKYFQYISAHNDDGTTILESTTKIDRLSEYMTKRNYRSQDTVIIGDSMEEPDIARHLGLTSIGITGGCINEARLRKANPCYLIHNLNDVSGILNGADT